MLITIDAVIITIYDHEENFQEMVDWLTQRTEKSAIHSTDGEFLGYRFITTEFMFKLFVDEFDICDLKGNKMV